MESEAKLKKMAEKFRQAKLSLLKAEFHLEAKGLEIDILKSTNFQNEVKYWEEILFEFIILNHKMDYTKIIKIGSNIRSINAFIREL
ncbi:MAG: hypothetical protein IPH96_07915 [Saprospiraceae bacterium]|nr:hypothetical protein [Saprospiraceae bacterium]